MGGQRLIISTVAHVDLACAALARSVGMVSDAEVRGAKN